MAAHPDGAHDAERKVLRRGISGKRRAFGVAIANWKIQFPVRLSAASLISPNAAPGSCPF